MNELDFLPDGLPIPSDDGACAHLEGARLPSLPLSSTDGGLTDLSELTGWGVVFAYPRTGVPGRAPLSESWDQIPGARGCTLQTSGYRDLTDDFQSLGVPVFGLSTQTTAYQKEMATRLGIRFPILSDSDLALTSALSLPTIDVADHTLLRRMAFVIRDGEIETVFYPVFPPNSCATRTLAWLRDHLRRSGSDSRRDNR